MAFAATGSACPPDGGQLHLQAYACSIAAELINAVNMQDTGLQCSYPTDFTEQIPITFYGKIQNLQMLNGRKIEIVFIELESGNSHTIEVPIKGLWLPVAK